MKNLLWPVGYKTEEDRSHGIKESYTIIATFATSQNAEDFINKCMPEATKHRFFIQCDNCRFYPVNHTIEEL